MTASGSTNMTAAIKIAIEMLTDKSGSKVICIVTDGMPDESDTALSAAKEAAEKDIDIMTIGTDGADEQFLRNLATRREHSFRVSRERLQHGIVSMAKLLPAKR